MENLNITLALAILLAAGLAAAKIGSLLRLPAVTGYILAGLALGPSGLHLIPHETGGSPLGHFTEMALMLIAFGIGEHLEIMRLRSRAKSVITIGMFEIAGAFLLVSTGTFLVARWIQVGGSAWSVQDYILLSTLLGAIAVATAPAATLHVMQEIGAAGPLTTTLMAVVAIDNGLAIMLFGIVVSITRHVTASGQDPLWMALGGGFLEIAGSLAMGVVTGILLDTMATRLKNAGEMLTAGLAALLLCGEIATRLSLSPLLAGIAAGFTIVNRDYRDIRLFRILNAFEPPIFVLFFTLAGVHLNLRSLIAAGWLGLAYYLLRVAGKISGATIGAHLVKTTASVKRYLGLGLTPQAGVAIGLIFLIEGDPATQTFSTIVGPVVLAGVLLSELIGPICTRKAVELAGEATASLSNSDRPAPLSSSSSSSSSSAAAQPHQDKTIDGLVIKGDPGSGNHPASPRIEVISEPEGVPMVPWTWRKLYHYTPWQPRSAFHSSRDRFSQTRLATSVVFEANHLGMTPALARISAIFAHHFQAIPTACHFIPDKQDRTIDQEERSDQIIQATRSELAIMGSRLSVRTHAIPSRSRALLETAVRNDAHTILIGYNTPKLPFSYQKTVEEIITSAPCPTLLIRLTKVLHTERILVPIVNMRDLAQLRMPILALAAVGEHQITILRLLPSYKTEKDQSKALVHLSRWIDAINLSHVATGAIEATEARVDTVKRFAENADLLLMSAPDTNGLSKLFFGSLMERIADSVKRNMIIVYPPSI